MSRVIGPADECVQCGEKKSTVRASQRKGGLHVLYCATVDYWGEVEAEWGRHRFIWTARDQQLEDEETAYWVGVSESLSSKEAS